MGLQVQAQPARSDAQITGTGRVQWRRRLPGWLVETWLRGQAALLYIFLYAPIAVVVLYSFNNSRRGMGWGGFTTKWDYAAWTNPDVTGSLQISPTAALAKAVLGGLPGPPAGL